MAGKKESKVQREVRRLLEHTLGGFWFKVHGGPFQRAGIPDLLGCYRGLYIGIEIKVDKGQTSDIQKTVMTLIRDAGGIAFVSRNPQHSLRTILKKARKLQIISKHEAMALSRKGDVFSYEKRKNRIVRRHGNWEDTYNDKRRRKAVAKRSS